ncbi:hypothetical protein [Streptomyces galbus]|nr:hypothetical protein [Streptomyces galbus]
MEIVLSEAAMARWTQQRACQATPDVVASSERQFTSIGLPPYPAWFEPMGRPVRWFSAPGLLLCLEPGSQGRDLVVIGRTEDDLQLALEAIPGAWPAAAPVVTGLVDGGDFILPF